MSERSDIATRICSKICEWRLTQPFGGDINKMGRYYGILFCRPRTLDGLVKVYGPKFIQVLSSGPLGRGSLVFQTEQDALDYIHAAFVKFDEEEAGKIVLKARTP